MSMKMDGSISIERLDVHISICDSDSFGYNVRLSRYSRQQINRYYRSLPEALSCLNMILTNCERDAIHKLSDDLPKSTDPRFIGDDYNFKK